MFTGSFNKKYEIICIALLSCSMVCLCQNHESSVEITALHRWNEYAAFNYTTNDINYFTVKIQGTSPGIGATYKLKYHKFLLKTGLGYYRYSFDKIKATHSVFPGDYNNRILDYVPSGYAIPSITFTTDKYWYHTIFINTGIEKEIILSKKAHLMTGLSLNNYFVVSSYYHIRYPYPEGTDYRASQFRYFGLSLSGIAGVQFKANRIGIAPFFILPIFDLWKQDKIFPDEQNNYCRSKWLKGVGAGMSFSYNLAN